MDEHSRIFDALQEKVKKNSRRQGVLMLAIVVVVIGLTLADLYLFVTTI